MASVLPKVTTSVNLTEQVHDALAAAIVDGTLEPGQLYSVQALADQFGVSRTPVREAMLQLARRGLVEMVRNQGVLIVKRSLDDLRDIFQVRLWLEVPAVREAARRAGDDDRRRFHGHYARMRSAALEGDAAALEREDRLLHEAILERSGNLRLVHMIDELRDYVIAHGQTTSGRSRTLLEIVEEHDAILAAIDRGDPDAAAAAMERHISSTAEKPLAQLSESGET